MNCAYQTSARWMMLWALALGTACGTDAREPAAPAASRHQGLLAADLSIAGTMQGSADPRDYILRYTIKNQGESEATNVQVSFLLAPGVIVRTLGGPDWSCRSDPAGSACTTATLAALAESQVTLDLEVPYGQTDATVTATASSDPSDPTPEDNSVTLVLAGNPQTPHLLGGGLGCNLVPRATAPAAPSWILFTALLGLVSWRRRRANAA